MRSYTQIEIGRGKLNQKDPAWKDKSLQGWKEELNRGNAQMRNCRITTNSAL